MITVSPSESFEAVFEHAPTGLVGTIGVRILDNIGGTPVARHTSAISEQPSGSGRYVATLTAPSTEGRYGVLWDTSPTGVATSTNSSSEDLVVSITGGGGLSSAPIVLPAGGVSPVVTQSFFIKRGDNEPLIYQVTELDATGTPRVVDVTGWTGNFKLRQTVGAGAILINQPFYISDPDGNQTSDGTWGLIAYDWGRTASPPRTGETDRSGLFLSEFETHRPSGVKKTYPTTSDVSGNREYITVQFVDDLDDAGGH